MNTVDRSDDLTRGVKARGFTLVELLVVIAIIGILVSMLLPAVQSAREAARRAQCTNQIKQIALALHNYHSAKGAFPPSSLNNYETSCTDGGARSPKPATLKFGNCSGAPWTVIILPYLEESALYDQFDLKEPFAALRDHAINKSSCNSQVNFDAQLQSVQTYLCPGDPVAAQQDTVMCYSICQGGGSISDDPQSHPIAHNGFTQACDSGSNNRLGMLFFNNGIAFANSDISASKVIDGTSHTLLVGENRLHMVIGEHKSQPERAKMWSSPESESSQYGVPASAAAAVNGINADGRTGAGSAYGEYYSRWIHHIWTSANFGSFHVGGANFAYADGSAHFLSEDIDLKVFQSTGMRANQGELLDGNNFVTVVE